MRNVRRYIVVSLLVLGWIGCSTGPTIVDGTDHPLVPCDVTDDCYSSPNWEPDTQCMYGWCLCPNPEHYFKPCCLKGAPEDDCDRGCRPREDCAPSDVSSGAAQGGAGGAGGALVSECASPADCPSAPDPECGRAQCIDGACVLDDKLFGKTLPSQLYGDCKRRDCDMSGHLVEVQDPSDYFNDGNQCTLDYCAGEEPRNDMIPDALQCPEAGMGRCYQGACVECIATDPAAAQCGKGLDCEGYWCVQSPQCSGQCGGICVPCSTGQGCSSDFDCASSKCVQGKCALPTCVDGKKNGEETGVDCGAASCKPCADGDGCAKHADCKSGVCKTGTCQVPTCFDAVKNGNETGVDCGGACSACP